MLGCCHLDAVDPPLFIAVCLFDRGAVHAVEQAGLVAPADDNTFTLDLKNYELARGDVLCVGVLPQAGAPDVIVSVNWVEDH